MCIYSRVEINNFKFLYLVFVFIFSFFASGCVQTKIYNDMYGFAEDNKEIYQSAKNMCTSLSLDAYPPKSFYIPPVYTPPQNSGGGASWGQAYYHGKMVYESQVAREQALNEMNLYNNARDNYYNMCMQKLGWRKIEVDEPLF